MDLDDELHAVRREARISELELWLAMMVALVGEPNGGGFQLRVTAQDAETLRSRISARPTVAIAFDLDHGMHVFDVL